MSDGCAKVKCPKCGLPVSDGEFCPMCGVKVTSVAETPTLSTSAAPTVSKPAAPTVTPPAAPTVRAPEPPTVRPPEPPKFSAPADSTPAPAVQGVPKGQLRVDFDALCILFEGLHGMLRLRLSCADGDVFDNVQITLRDLLTNAEFARTICLLDHAREITVPIRPKQAGTAVWDVCLSYDFNGRHVELEGEWATVVTGRAGARMDAKQLAITINQDIKGGHACEIHNSLDAVGELNKALASADGEVYDTLNRIVIGGARAYRWIDLYPRRVSGALPPMPPEAAADRMTLDLGIWKVKFFSGRTVTFGRTKELNDIALRPPEGEDSMPYKMISRRHCRFAHSGSEVIVADGARDEKGVVNPSSWGTFLDGEQLRDEVRLSAKGTSSGRLTFAGAGGNSVVSLDLRVLTSGDLCKDCPRSDRAGCQGGARPSLLMRRTDGIPECFVAVWSCVRLEDVDPSYAGVKVFREGNGFAWRRGRRCGWLVPGMKADDLMIS